MQILKMIVYFIYMIYTVFKEIKFKLIYKTKGEKQALKYGQGAFSKWSDFTIKMIGIDLEVKGRENIPDEACAFIGNHMSILDIPVLRQASRRDVGFVAKKEILKVPMLRFWINNLNCVALDRESPREAIRVINEGANYLKNGYDMTIFPEGTRSKDGKVHEFKKGSMKLAVKAKAPIVPVSINGTSKCFEDNKKFTKGKVTIVFGKPIYTKDLSREEEKELTQRVHDEVLKNMIWVK